MHYRSTKYFSNGAINIVCAIILQSWLNIYGHMIGSRTRAPRAYIYPPTRHAQCISHLQDLTTSTYVVNDLYLHIRGQSSRGHEQRANALVLSTDPPISAALGVLHHQYMGRKCLETARPSHFHSIGCIASPVHGRKGLETCMVMLMLQYIQHCGNGRVWGRDYKCICINGQGRWVWL